jgi:hypothetical protein
MAPKYDWEIRAERRRELANGPGLDPDLRAWIADVNSFVSWGPTTTSTTTTTTTTTA